MSKDNFHGAPERLASNLGANSTNRIDAQALFGSYREVILTLQESDYRLRITSNGKLILTK